MVQPANYIFQNPQQGVMQGVMQGITLADAIQNREMRKEQMGFAREKMDAWRQQQELQKQQAAAVAEQQAAMQRQLEELAENPTSRNMRQMIIKNPQLAEPFKQSLEMLGEEEAQSRINRTLPLYMSLQSGNIDMAKSKANELSALYSESGDADMAKLFQDVGKIIEADPDMAKIAVGIPIMAGASPDVVENVLNAEKQLNDQKLSQKRFEIDMKKIEKQMQRERDAESGLVEPEKRPEYELKLRNQYVKEAGEFSKVEDAYSRVISSKDDAAGDLGLIFNYMKMLDPGSVVREGEFANAQNAAGVPDRVVNLYNQLLTGERLKPKQRDMFKGQAEAYFDAMAQKEDRIRKRIQKQAKNYGLNLDNIFLRESATKPQAGTMSAPQESTATTPEAPDWFKKYQSQGK